MIDDELRAALRDGIARLTDDRLNATDIRDDEPLFAIPGEIESRINLDSLDGLELAFMVEELTGMEQPADLDPRQLLTVNDIISFVRARAPFESGSRL